MPARYPLAVSMLRTLFRLTLGARLPMVQGTLTVPALCAPVRIRRDDNAVAYIEASCDADAFYAMGFCQGQDRAFQIDFYLRVVHGRLAEVAGADVLPVDQLSRRIDFTGISRAQFACLEAGSRAHFAHFARGVDDGVRLGLAKRPHELTLLGAAPTPFEPADSIALVQFFAFALSSNWDAELARLRILRGDGPEALAALEAAHPDWLRPQSLLQYQAGNPSAEGAATRLLSDAEALAAAERFLAGAAALKGIAGAGGASNAWVLAPSRTATGRPVVACDPHLGPSMPAPWYLMHVRTPEWAMTGACFPGLPVMSFGHNERVAWGLTAGHVDNTDLFLEKVGPDGRSVLEGDEFIPCETRDEIIRVRGKKDVRETVLTTRRGPIVSPALAGDTGALSLRGTWMAARPSAAYDLYRAVRVSSVEQARELFASFPGTSENRVFADIDGHIAWQVVGDAPVRRSGHGMLPMAGWDPDAGWEDEPLPFDKLPHAIDPEEGFLASANNAPPNGTGDVFLGADWLDGHRYARVVEVLATRHNWDVDSTMALQLDRSSLVWRAVRDRVLAALGASTTATRSAAPALALLQDWDGVVAADSPAAAVFELFFAEMMRRCMKAKAPHSWQAALGLGTNVILSHGMMALRRNAQLERLLVQQPTGWFAHGWEAEMADALRAAVETLRAETLRARAGQPALSSRPGATASTAKAGEPGEDTSRWAWGSVRQLTLEHALGRLPFIGRLFNVGPLPCGGDATTIPQASVDFARPLENPIGIPNMRLVMDVGNWEASRWVLAGGQSGNPLSRHYRDMIPLWERGHGITIAWSPQDVERVAIARLTLNGEKRP